MVVTAAAMVAAPVEIISVVVPLMMLLLLLQQVAVLTSMLAIPPSELVVLPVDEVTEDSAAEPMVHTETAAGAGGRAANGGATAAMEAQFTIAEHVDFRLDGAMGLAARATTGAFILDRLLLTALMVDSDEFDEAVAALAEPFNEDPLRVPKALTTTPEAATLEPFAEPFDVPAAGKLLTKGLRLSRSARL